MKILFSNSDLIKQFRSFASNVSGFTTLFVDQAFELEVTEASISISQAGAKVQFTAADVVVFLLFREPHELMDDANIALAIHENFALLADACDMLGVRTVNHPESWRRAYSKVGLLRIRKTNPDLVPASFMLCGKSKSDPLSQQVTWIAKSGYGVKRPVGGLMPRCGTVTTARFETDVAYRYVLQEYLPPQAEFRVYVTRSDLASEATVLAMPIGTQEGPDWRDTSAADSMRCSSVPDKVLSRLALRLADQLNLESVSFDFIRSKDRLFLIDINPHGSWYWLPQDSRELIETQMKQWLNIL